MPDGGGRATLTLGMTDSGLNEVTRILDDATGGHHYSIKGISALREPDGSHGVWGARASVMVYKIIHAAKRANLAILAFDINQKARCAAPAALRHARRLRTRRLRTARSRRRRSRCYTSPPPPG